MEPQLKQRLVGIAVIFSLAVIFLPMILDGSGQQRKSFEIEVPARPELKSEVDVEQRVLEIRNDIAALPELKPLILDEQSPAPQEPPPEVAQDSQASTVAKARRASRVYP